MLQSLAVCLVPMVTCWIAAFPTEKGKKKQQSLEVSKNDVIKAVLFVLPFRCSFKI